MKNSNRKSRRCRLWLQYLWAIFFHFLNSRSWGWGIHLWLTWEWKEDHLRSNIFLCLIMKLLTVAGNYSYWRDKSVEKLQKNSISFNFFSLCCVLRQNFTLEASWSQIWNPFFCLWGTGIGMCHTQLWDSSSITKTNLKAQKNYKKKKTKSHD